MNSAFYRANYCLKLYDNAVTDKVREKLLASVKEDSDYKKILSDLITTVFTKLSKSEFDKNVELELIKTEYEKLNLVSQFGDYSDLESYFGFLVNEILNVNDQQTNNRNYEIYKKIINFLDNTENVNLKSGVYQLILSFLVNNNLVLEDKDFSYKLIDYLDENEDKNDNTISDIFKDITRTAFFNN